MSLREHVLHKIDRIDDAQLQDVADFLAFLSFRSRRQPVVLDDATLAALYAEGAEEDLELAEAGMEEYRDALLAEDRA